MTLIADVTTFMIASGHLREDRRFCVRQTALQTGFQLEEMAEKLEAIGLTTMPTRLHSLSNAFKEGRLDVLISDANRQDLLDADIDLAWVTIGSALSQGADVRGAACEVGRANLSKIGQDGSVVKDANGKVVKPEGWTPPDLSKFIGR